MLASVYTASYVYLMVSNQNSCSRRVYRDRGSHGEK